jgi:CheY-like chemotaxis protein
MEHQISKQKILIVDDEPNVRQLVSGLLAEDYIVIEASNGKEAVNAAFEQQPDLVLMDIMMPDVDGYTACYIIKSNPATGALPVVMLTGVGHELNKKLSQQFGADAYVTKPFGLQELKDIIARLLPAS